MRILVAAHHTWGVVCLDELVRTGRNVVAVITYPDSFELQAGPYYEVWYESVKCCAERHGIPVLQPSDINSPDCRALIADLAPDIIVNVAYGQIYKAAILEIPPLGIVNLHGSLLPKYRGTTPIVSAILNGDNEVGVSLHFISDRIDEGDIILQRSIVISDDDYPDDVFAKTLPLYPQMLSEGLSQLETGPPQRTPQKSAGASYYPRRERRSEEIDWNGNALQICNFIRALSYPFRGAYTYYERQPLIIWRAALLDNVDCHIGFPGQVISRSEHGVIVKTKDTALSLLQVESADRRRMPANQFLGRRSVGHRLGLDFDAELRSLSDRVKALEESRADR